MNILNTHLVLWCRETCGSGAGGVGWMGCLSSPVKGFRQKDEIIIG